MYKKNMFPIRCRNPACKKAEVIIVVKKGFVGINPYRFTTER
jgi:hypothetical protein